MIEYEREISFARRGRSLHDCGYSIVKERLGLPSGCIGPSLGFYVNTGRLFSLSIFLNWPVTPSPTCGPPLTSARSSGAERLRLLGVVPTVVSPGAIWVSDPVAVHESRATSVQKASSCEATSPACWSIRPERLSCGFGFQANRRNLPGNNDPLRLNESSRSTYCCSTTSSTECAISPPAGLPAVQALHLRGRAHFPRGRKACHGLHDDRRRELGSQGGPSLGRLGCTGRGSGSEAPNP